MKRAVIERDREVDHGVAGKIAPSACLLNTLLDGWDEPPRDGATEDLVDDLELLSAFERRALDLAITELSMAAGLLLVASMRFGRCLDRLPIRNPGQLEVDPDPKPSLQLGYSHIDV